MPPGFKIIPIPISANQFASFITGLVYEKRGNCDDRIFHI